MPRRKLSDAFLKKVKAPAAGRVDYFDAAYPGLACRVAASGTRTWTLFARVDGKQIRHKLGRYPAMSLRDARRAADGVREQVEAGKDPRHEARRQRQAAARLRADTVRAVAERFLADIGAPGEGYEAIKPTRPLRTAGEVRRTLEMSLLAEHGDRPIREITRRDLIDMLDRIASERGGTTANRAMAWSRRLFRWAIAKDILDASPAAGLRPPAAERSRERVLTDAELRDLWGAFESLPYPHGPFLKLLLLTGQRRGEIASLRWDEINDRDALIELAGSRYKTGRPHVVPLAPAAVDILGTLPRFEGCAYCFTTNAKVPIRDFSTAKAQVDEKVAAARSEALPAWVLHDLRRTARTCLPRLGIAPDVAERVMGHTIGGVRAAYDRYDYLPQKRHALETWARHLAELVKPSAGNVVAIHG